jgi:hypothetical protein
MKRLWLLVALWAVVLLLATAPAEAQMGYGYRPYAYGGYAYYYPRTYAYNVSYGGVLARPYPNYSGWVNAGYPFRTYSYYSNFSGAFPTYGYIYGYPYYASGYRAYGW